MQGDEARTALYTQLEEEFVARGIDGGAVEAAAANFGGLEQSDWPGVWPNDYPMAYPSVRLVVIPLDGGQFAHPANARLAHASATVTRQVSKERVRAVGTPLPPLRCSSRSLSDPLVAGPQVMTLLVRAGCSVYSNPRASYHASMFYMSHPSDLRPDTAVAGGGTVLRNGVVVAPTEEALEVSS